MESMLAPRLADTRASYYIYQGSVKDFQQARGVRLVAEGFADAQRLRRAAQRKYPFSTE
jgi:hypothetical protein